MASTGVQVTATDPIRGRRAQKQGISIGPSEADLRCMGLFGGIRSSSIPGTSDSNPRSGHRHLLVVRSPLSILFAVCALVAVATPAAFAHTGRQNNVVVAIIDTGVSPTKQLTSRLLPGWDFVDNDAKATDENGHGTELASIVVAQCPRCAILPVRVLGQGGLGSVATVIRGIQWAVAQGADVINLSLTTPSDNPDLTATIEWAVGQGVTTVIAAGNRGSSTAYPGMTTPNAIAVGSVDPSGNPLSWSNYGPWVDLSAPGTLPAQSMRDRKVSAVGTSASAAYVAGAAGALLECDRSLTPPLIASHLIASLSAPLC